ncbi:MAG: hypothetical protein ABMA00_08105 [Gemmatimonas sp.]
MSAQPLAPLTPTSIRQDLALMREQFLGIEASYSPGARAEAERRIARLEVVADTLQRGFLELEIARIVALADNGHTSVPGAMRASHFNRVAIRLTPFGEEFYVLRAQSQHADLLGARLLAIDGKPMAMLRTAARSLSGGTAAWRDRQAPFLFESPEQLHALGVITASTAATYRFQLATGGTVERRLVADSANAATPRANTSRWMYPEPPASDGREWRSLMAVAQAPWSLQEPTTRFRWRDAPELDGVVIELRQNVSAPNVMIRTFLMQMDTLLRVQKPRHVVLDMRMNGGGDLNTTRAFVQSLPTLVSGRIFVLTSPHTFSAAISTVGYLKQAAPERVSIVGEMVGDRLEFWAEGRPVTLPGSGILIGRATERHDYATGCKPYSDCHGAVVRSPISVKTLAPDLSAPWTLADYRAGRDPGMAAIAAELRR